MNLQKMMNFHIHGDKLREINVKVYLFGSARKSSSPRDIDLLLIYDKELITVDRILWIKNYIRNYIDSKFNKPVDIIVLSQKEEKESNFIKEENCVYIGSI